MPDGPSVTARIGRWSFRHRWIVLGIWLIAVVGGLLASGLVFSGLSDGNGPKSMESVHANAVSDAADTTGQTLVGILPHTGPKVAAVVSDLRRVPGVTDVTTAIGADGTTVAVRVTLTKNAADTTTSLVTGELRTLGPNVLVGGGTLVSDQADAQAQTDLSKAEAISLPITLVILVIVFGGLIAAGLPVFAAVVSIAGSLGVLLGFMQFTDIGSDAVTVITLLGLGLSIDYGLLLVARYKEELAFGHDPETAIGRAWATAGRTIVFSGLTVAAALSGMLVFGVSALSALGAAGVSITLVAMIVGLTLTAAMIGFAKRRIKPSKRTPDRHGIFTKLARGVQRRPLLVALTTTAVLLAGGLPILSTKVSLDNVDGLPRSLESVRALDVLAAQYGASETDPITVVAQGTATQLDRWATTITDVPGVTGVKPAQQLNASVATIEIDTAGKPEGPTALHVVDVLRAHRPPGMASWVTGDAAMHRDLMNRIWDRLPYAIALTLLVMFVLLFAMTGSVVVPIKAIAMNLVSLTATFGALVAIFQHGLFAGVLHTTTVSGLSPYVVVSVFAFAFGLSMDYEVFLLARIKEYVDRGEPTAAAVRHGLQGSGRIITSAALLMVVVFGCFVTGRIDNVQQIGLGLAIAVAIDATLVRCVLVPATMTLLGRVNWWAPPWLGRTRDRFGLDHYLDESSYASESSPEPAATPESADSRA